MDEDYVYGILSAVKDFEAVNFDYGNDLFNYCRKFEYDWKRDLPDIAQLIDMKYPEGCEVILTYKEWFEAGVICDKKIFAKTLLKEKLRSRRLFIYKENSDDYLSFLEFLYLFSSLSLFLVKNS